MYKVGAVVVTLLLALGGVLLGESAYAVKLNEAVGKPLQEAQKLAQQRNWSGAIAAAKRAQAAAKSQQEQATVNQMLMYLYTTSGNAGGAADAMEASGGNLKTICQLRLQARQADKAMKVCSEYAERNRDPQARMWVAKMLYDQRNYAKAAQMARNSVTGGGANKALIELAAASYFQLHDEAGQLWAAEQLVTNYPTPEGWKTLLTMVRNKVHGDTRFDLDILRLKAATGVTEAKDLMESSQLALQLGLPNEAKNALEAAVKAGTFGAGKDKDREMRLVTMARTQAASDLANIAKAEAAAKAAPSGEQDVHVGEALVTQGKFDQGIAAIQRGIGKGRLKDPADAQLRLGLAQYKAGKRDAAVKTLGAVKGTSNSVTIARLWAIHLRRA